MMHYIFSHNTARVSAVLLVIHCCISAVYAQSGIVENFNIQFAQTDTVISDTFDQNRISLSRLDDLAAKLVSGGQLSVDSVVIYGWSSPEGTAAQNAFLASARQNVMHKLLTSYNIGAPARMRKGKCGIAWHELEQRLSEEKPDYAPDVLKILSDRPLPGKTDTRKKRLMDHNYGRTWHKMMIDYFPSLRHASATVYLSCRALPAADYSGQPSLSTVEEENSIISVEEKQESEDYPLSEAAGKRFYMSVSTNMLYDIAALPNLGVEFYLGKRFSVAGNWMYGWWDSKTKNRFWRAYGGMIAGRYWFGRLAEEKPLTGHHLGVYAQALIYDFEWGGKGYLGGTPGHNIFDHPSVGAGVEYGFALPVSRRLNIDFNIGVGYLGGRYYEYEPKDDHYVWLRTKRRNWFGPTKLEINLVWLIGNGNSNRKGGKK